MTPASNCYNTAIVNGACQTTTPVATSAYVGDRCISQGQSAQLVARVYAGATNVSCLVGPLSFSSLNPSTVTIDVNGLATAAAPGSGIIQASNILTSSSAGFFSTCPPATISLAAAGATAPPTAPLTVNTNSSQSLVATIKDTNGNPINNVALTYVSTTPITIPATGNVITPIYPGSGTISALCEPPTCNASSFPLVGLYGNGLPIVSNPVQINSNGTANSTVLYIASTNSQYVQPVDFTATSQAAPTRLDYTPNSMVITNDLSTIYMGSSNELMVLSVAGSNVTVAARYPGIMGKVLAVSPDSSTVIVTDPTRNLTYLIGNSGNLLTEIGGTGTRAAWTQDSTTVYITTTDGRLLVHSSFLGWQPVTTGQVSDVVVTVPNVGLYLGGNPVQARTNCPATTINMPGTGFNQTTTNAFYPQVANTLAATADRLAATNDGAHILGANVTGLSDIVTNVKSGSCQNLTFANTYNGPKAFTGIAPTAINSVLATTDSAFSFVTYQGTGAAVPQYVPATGTLSLIPLQQTASGAPIAPVSGVISSDNLTFYVGTSGDKHRPSPDPRYRRICRYHHARHPRARRLHRRHRDA